jgi:hypothetical protein
LGAQTKKKREREKGKKEAFRVADGVGDDAGARRANSMAIRIPYLSLCGDHAIGPGRDGVMRCLLSLARAGNRACMRCSFSGLMVCSYFFLF